LAVIAASNSSYLSLTALCPSFLCLLLLLHQSVIEFGNNFFFPCSLKFFLPLAAAWCPGSSSFGFEFLTRAACSNTVSSTGRTATELYLHNRQIDSTHQQLVSLHPYWSSAELNSSLYCEISSYIIIRFISVRSNISMFYSNFPIVKQTTSFLHRGNSSSSWSMVPQGILESLTNESCVLMCGRWCIFLHSSTYTFRELYERDQRLPWVRAESRNTDVLSVKTRNLKRWPHITT